MIDNRLKNLIYPNLKMELEEHDWKWIEYMLNNAYFSIEYGEERITLPPPPTSDGKYCLQFSALTGTFVSIDFWDAAKARGVKL